MQLVLVDPPYGTTQNKWDSVLPLDVIWTYLEGLLSNNGNAVFTSCQPFTSVLTLSNLTRYKYDWVWNKSKVTGVLNAKRQPLRNHENVLVFSYSSNPLYNPQGLVPVPVPVPVRQGSSSKNYGERGRYGYTQHVTGYPRTVLEIPSQGKTIHPTQKPVALMEYLIKTYSNEGDLVLDFAMGSGTTGVACGNLNRRFIGIEIDKEHGYFEIAERRIREAYKGRKYA